MKSTLKSIAFAGLLGLVGCSPSTNVQHARLDQVFTVQFPDATILSIYDMDGDGNVDFVKNGVDKNNETYYVRLGYKPKSDFLKRPTTMTPSQLRASQDLYEQIKIANSFFRVTEDKK